MVCQYIVSHFWFRLIVGLSLSMGVGSLAIWYLVEKILWPHARPGYKTSPEGLTWLTGIVERGLYTTALVLGAPQWVGIWLVMKAASRWGDSETRERSQDIWMIGSGLSVLFGFLGAWFALWKLPVMK